MQYGHKRPELSIAWGAGGAYGIAYNLAVREVLAERGIDLRLARHLGTSAGAWAAAFIATEQGIEDSEGIPDISIYSLETRKPDYLRSIARDMFGDARSEAVRAATIRLGVPNRPVILEGREHDLADMAAASGAVPGLFAPVKIDGDYYIDGGTGSCSNLGIGSMAHADKAENADWLLATEPLGFPVSASIALSSLTKSVVGREVRHRAERERERWQRQVGGLGTALLMPDSKTAELIHDPSDLFRRQVGLEVYDRTLDHVYDLSCKPDGELSALVNAIASEA